MAKDKPNVFYNCRESSTNRPYFMQNKPNFLKAQMNVNSFITKDYRKNDAFAVQKNKPNSNPNKANLKRAKMDVNIYYTEVYENKWKRRVRKNKPNSNPIKANFKRDDGFSAYYTRDCHGTHRFNRAVEGRGSEKGPAEKANARAQKSF